MVTGTACGMYEWLLGLPSFSIQLRFPRSSQQTFLLSCLLPLEPFLSFPVSSPLPPACAPVKLSRHPA